MKNMIKSTVFMLLMINSLHAEVSWIATPQSQTLVESAVVAHKGNHQQAVSFNQSLLGQDELMFQNQGYLAQSKQFWLDVSGAELNKGVQLPLHSDTAVVRISPLETVNNKSWQPGQLSLTLNDQPIEPTVLATAEQLKAAGMPLGNEAIGFKVQGLDDGGDLTLKLPGNAADAGYIVHVLEPESQHELKLQTGQQQYASGADVVITANLMHHKQAKPAQVQGYVTRPNGEKLQDLAFQKNSDGGYQAVVAGMTGEPLLNGLWEVHIVSTGEHKGRPVLRDASTAFAVHMPTAQFNGQLSNVAQKLSIGIETATPSRYEISGVLMGLNENQEKQAIALMMSAKWLEVGVDAIQLDLPVELMKQSGLTAPYSIEQVTLKNQSLMVPVQSVVQGIRIEALDESVLDQR